MPVSWAPAEPEDENWLHASIAPAGIVIRQGAGNLGERIACVNRALLDRRLEAQLFIGIDCPALTPAYLAAAAEALDSSDAVLGPATDGGVVLMGVRGRWPGLRELPWSAASLGDALAGACRAAGMSVALLPALSDVDAPADLRRACQRLETDRRPARRALCQWMSNAATLAETA